MKKSHWIGVAGVLALVGCMTQVDREAVSFPDMPNVPTYHRADNQQLPPEQAIDALRTAEDTCQTQAPGDATSSSAIGSPAFDSCMQVQGYRRVR